MQSKLSNLVNTYLPDSLLIFYHYILLFIDIFKLHAAKIQLTACFTARKNATAAAQPKPEKIEVFVNDKKVLVDPGTTVLQVSNF